MRWFPHFPLLLVATAAACSSGSTGPSPEMTLTALEHANGPSRPVGTDLDQPLRVEVRVNGIPRSGVEVTWGAAHGELTGLTSITDADGIATARWRLGPLPGSQLVWAAIREVSHPVYFTVEAVPGPPDAILKVAGDGQVINILAPKAPKDLVVQVVDRFSNPIPDAAVIWSVVEGPVVIAETPRAAGGYYSLTVAGTGPAGTARIQASVGGVMGPESFTLKFEEGPWAVAISNLRSYHLIGFLSMQNGTSPAIDTVRAGGTVQFRMEDYWDVAQSHDVVPVGSPAFPPCPLASGLYDEVCEVTLTEPGTYRYALSGNPLVTGTIVVRSP